MDTTNSLPVVIYTTPGCVQCNLTKKWLEKNQVQHQIVDVTEDSIGLQKIKQMGYQAAPVVIVPFDWPIAGEHWYGFRPDKLGQLL